MTFERRITNNLYSIVLAFLHLTGDIFCSIDSYDIRYLYGEGICDFKGNLQSDKFVSLRNPNQGYIFKQSWFLFAFEGTSYCSFELKAPDDMGFFITAREIKLRKNATGECVDTIEVKYDSKKYEFCDSSDSFNKLRSFRTGENVSITININKDIPLDLIGDMFIELVVTIRRNCGPEYHVQCDEDDRGSCISPGFQNDDIVNCPDCSDEISCLKENLESPVKSRPKVSGSNVLLWTIVALLVTTIIFGTFLCRLFNQRREITENNSGSRPRNDDQNQTVQIPNSSLSFTTNQITLRNEFEPSAPSEETEEEQPPPHYETLYK
ncbi:uncharacterized protein LOC129740423 [Uranotaenia lowii]|uniref:uncharacterized protein LOC129740423 n=1 Tax=Uranotaenia lowii TaxID=190385 RepID=UPI00247AE40D|nr:uncharacterized protein LOC129740423 [Uranotaenia lowii]XP_055588069.1 uncharacterized protein LOC129740423 [Uranotaenia lowii]XP_055588072.1 uncharacterized protein LOC129740423 [Uranotaenia lowii]